MESQIRKEIADILGIDPQGSWKITDSNSEKGYYMIRHNEPVKDPVKWGAIKGILVNLNTKVKLTAPYGHTPTCKTRFLDVKYNKLKLIDDEGNKLNFAIEDVVLKYGFEGLMLNVSKDGEILVSSRRKIDVSTSTRDDDVSFLEKFKSLGGPTDALFTKKYSPFSHRFIVVHPSLFRASKMDVGPGFLVYLGAVKTYDTHPYPKEETEVEPVKLNTVNQINFPIVKPFIYESPNLTIQQANKHLKSGWGENSNMGEFIILSHGNTQYRVASDAYLYRWNLRGDAPNIYYRFYQLYDYSVIDPKDRTEFTKFKNKFLPLDYVQPEALETFLADHEYKITAWPGTGVSCNFNTWLQRLTLIWYNLLYVSPLNRGEQVAGFLKKFLEDRRKLIDFLIEHTDTEKLAHVPERMVQILNNTKNSEDRNREIKRTIAVEGGPSLYKMVTYVRKFKPVEVSED